MSLWLGGLGGHSLCNLTWKKKSPFCTSTTHSFSQTVHLVICLWFQPFTQAPLRFVSPFFLFSFVIHRNLCPFSFDLVLNFDFPVYLFVFSFFHLLTTVLVYQLCCSLLRQTVAHHFPIHSFLGALALFSFNYINFTTSSMPLLNTPYIYACFDSLQFQHQVVFNACSCTTLHKWIPE